MIKNLLLTIISSCLILASHAQQQLENPGFEDWEDAGTVKDEPVDWSSIKTSDVPSLNTAAPVVWGKSTDAHTGNYSLKLFNVSVFNLVATGTATNGRVHSDMIPDNGYIFTNPDNAKWHTPLTYRPDSLVGWYKFFPQGEDFGQVRSIIHTGSGQIPENGTFSNWVGEAIFLFPSEEISTWTRFSVPFTYYSSNNPEYILLVLNSGNGTTAIEGSKAFFDDLQLIYNPEGLEESMDGEFIVYAYNNSLFLNIQSPEKYQCMIMEVFDLSGRMLIGRSFTPDRSNVFHVNLKPGMYVCRIQAGIRTINQKLYVY